MIQANVSEGSALQEHERRLLTAVDDTISGWLEQMQAMRRMEGELGARLMQCHTAREAVGLSTEWLEKRLDSLIATQHRLIELWLECNAEHSIAAAECRGPERKRRGRPAQ